MKVLYIAESKPVFEAEGATLDADYCNSLSIEKAANGYVVRQSLELPRPGYDYPKHETKRYVFQTQKGLMAFVTKCTALKESEKAKLRS